MSHVYRCSRCRTRNTFARAVGSYIRPRHCRDCGYTRFYVDRERIMRPVCRCNAYHWPAHRPGSPMCEKNPRVDANRAKRQGLDEDEILWLGLGAIVALPGDPPPF